MEEIWKDIIGYEGLYQVSNLGRVKSLPRKTWNGKGNFITKERVLKHGLDTNGYPIVVLCLNGKMTTHKIHRLSAIQFILNPKNKHCVNHINGIKTDNRLENLEWVTSKENIKHAFDTGLKKSMKGEKNGASKLTDYQVLEIKERLKKGESNTYIAKTYNVTQPIISYIKNNINWNHISN